MTEQQREDELVAAYFRGTLSARRFRTYESVILTRQKEMISKLFTASGYVAIFSYNKLGSDYISVVGLILPTPN